MKCLKTFRNQEGKIGYILLWLLGIPIPNFGCDISAAWLHVIGTSSFSRYQNKLLNPSS